MCPGGGRAAFCWGLRGSERFWPSDLLSRGPAGRPGVGFLAFAATSPYWVIRFPQTVRATLHLAYQGTSLGGARDFSREPEIIFSSVFWQFGPAWWLAAVCCMGLAPLPVPFAFPRQPRLLDGRPGRDPLFHLPSPRPCGLRLAGTMLPASHGWSCLPRRLMVRLASGGATTRLSLGWQGRLRGRGGLAV